MSNSSTITLSEVVRITEAMEGLFAALEVLGRDAISHDLAKLVLELVAPWDDFREDPVINGAATMGASRYPGHTIHVMADRVNELTAAVRAGVRDFSDFSHRWFSSQGEV